MSDQSGEIKTVSPPVVSSPKKDIDKAQLLPNERVRQSRVSS